MRLSQKIAIIAGGDEIGRGIATRFANEGAEVVIVDRPGERASAPPDSLTSVSSDVGTRAAAAQVVRDIAERFGGVHVLVNNLIRPQARAPLEARDEAMFSATMTDVAASLWMMQAVFPYFRKQSWGRIVNLDSRYGCLMNNNIGEYNAAVWALRGLTRVAASEWAKHHIAVNMLETAADTTDYREFRAAYPEIVDALVAQVPMRRRGDPVDDIGAAAAFLACDETNMINGQVVYADGGQHLAAPVFNLALENILGVAMNSRTNE